MRGRQRFDKDINMKKDLLIVIAFHYSPERLQYLKRLYANFCTYQCSISIIIDTNDNSWYEHFPHCTLFDTKIIYHENLEHPFHLTWFHRQNIKDNIDNYNNFAYFEDDMMLPYENYLNYLFNFKMLWPEYVPSFIRIEEHGWEKFVADIHEKQPLEVVDTNYGKKFAYLKSVENYHAFWIMPQYELKNIIQNDFDFVKLDQGREFAAMFVGWTLGKQTLVELENNKVSKLCYSYHLPNNAPNVNLKVEEIFI